MFAKTALRKKPQYAGSKKELAESLIQTDGNVLKVLSKEDLLKLFE